ncbi:restriction endonuclease subunit S [Pseudescherichia sp.]|uniref:restriction endonuclease subunit S n=1 Tax=Pseudescherichia sp. TaxID=2055881 RepID=UPI00289D3FA6|nr:restriction endonuclease subunit S [Pseudescherichia sp.]
MAKYKAYPEYKDSGVEWLGEIPDHWPTLAIKHVAQLNPSKSCISIEQMKGMCSFIPMEKLKFNSLILDEVKDVSDMYNGYTYFENEDILIAKVTPCFENKNMVVAHDLHNGIGFGSSEIYVLRCNDIINNDFLFYRLQEDNFMSIAEGAMTGAGGLKRVPSDILNNFKFGLPRVKEQSIIVNFLKHETAKIDSLIEKQQQLIELLKEKRQAVISHAVTKGLNPNVPMKDSGVEWLGKVPENWDVIKLKYLINVFEQGWSPQCEARLSEGNEYGVLKVGCVNTGDFNPLEHKALPSNLEPQKQYLVKKDDLLISRANTKELVGSSAVVEKDYDNLILCDKLYRLKFEDPVNPYFISEFIRTPMVRKQVELSASGASHSMQNIGQDTIKELFVALPPEDETQQLIAFIKNETSVFDSLMNLSNRQVALLQERRTALISAAVTGKIDVRDWIAPDTQDVEESQEATA